MYHDLNPPHQSTQAAMDLIYEEADKTVTHILTVNALPFQKLGPALYAQLRQKKALSADTTIFALDYLVPLEYFLDAADILESYDCFILTASYTSRKSYFLKIGSSTAVISLYSAITNGSHSLFEYVPNALSTIGELPREYALAYIMFKLFNTRLVKGIQKDSLPIRFFSDSSSLNWKVFWEILDRGKLKKFTIAQLKFHLRGTQILQKALAPLGWYDRWFQRSFSVAITGTLCKSSFFHTLVKTSDSSPMLYTLSQRILHLLLFRHVKKIKKINYRVLRKIATAPLNDAIDTAIGNSWKYTRQHFPPVAITPIQIEPVLINTSGGLLYLHQNAIHRLSSSYGYGITIQRKQIYVHQEIGDSSRIVAYRISDRFGAPTLKEPRLVVSGLPRGIHQIDILDEELFIADAFLSRIFVYSLQGRLLRSASPGGKITKKNKPVTDFHFNSLYVTKDVVYLLAHNGTRKQEKNSQIFILNRKTLKILDIVELPAFKAHNIIPIENHFLYCDSQRGTVNLGESILLPKRDYFLRGLALTKQHLIVGGSDRLKRIHRSSGNAAIYILTHEGEIKQEIVLKKMGQIFEIRAVHNDWSLSQHYPAPLLQSSPSSETKQQPTIA